MLVLFYFFLITIYKVTYASVAYLGEVDSALQQKVFCKKKRIPQKINKIVINKKTMEKLTDLNYLSL